MDMFGLGILLNAKDQASASILRVNSALQGLTQTMEEAGDISESQMNRITNMMNSASESITKGLQLVSVGSEITNFGTSLLDPIVAVGKETVATGSQFEQWRMTLNALYKDSEVATAKATEAMQLAAKTPFEVGDVMEALIGFKAIGAEALTVMDNVEGASDQTRTFLEYVGDLASLRPDVGLNGVLLGIRNLIGGDGGKSLKMRMDIDFEQIMGEDWKDTPEEIMQQLANVSQQIAGGLMNELEGTWSQMLSNLEDQKTRFFLAISDSGAFDSFKGSLKYISDAIGSIDDGKMARIGQNIASAFSMIWKPIDFLIKRLTDFGMAIINLIETSPLVSKLVVGLTSLIGVTAIVIGGLFTLSGAFLIVQGAIKVIQLAFASLGPVMLSFKTKLLSLGTSLLLILPKIALLTTAVTLLYKAWKSDFGGIKTTLTGFVKSTSSAFKDSTNIANMGVNAMMNALNNLNKDTWYGRLTYNLTKLKVFWIGLCDAWNDYELSDENFQKLNALGLLPLLGTILDLKMRAEAFFEGFKQGWRNISNVVVPIVQTITKFIKDIVLALLPAKDKVDEFQNSTEGLNTQPWYDVGEAIAYVTGILAGIWVISKVVGVISTVTSAISGIVGFITKIPGVITEAFTSITGFFSSLGGLIASALGWIGGLVTAILGAFGIVISAPAWVVGAITLVVSGLVALVIKYWDQIKEWTINTWNTIKDKTLEIWGGIKDWYNATIQPWVDKIAEAFNKAKDKLVEIWGNVKSYFVEKWGEIKTWYQSNIQPWVDKIATFFQRCKDKLVDIFTSIKDVFVEKWNSLKTWYQTNIAPWVEIIAKLFDIAFALIRAGVLILKEKFIEAWGNIKQWYTDTIEPWIEAIKQGWNDCKTKVSEFFSGIKDYFIEKWSELKQWYADTIQPWIDAVVNGWDSFKTKVGELWTGVKDFFVAKWQEITVWYDSTIQPWVDKIKTGWETFKTNVGLVFSGIKEGFLTAWNGIKDWYDSTIAPWITRIQGVWDSFKIMVSGVWDTISTAWHTTLGNLYNWVVEKVNGLIDLVNKIPFVEIEKIESKTGSSAPVSKNSVNKMVGLNTGGYVKTEGVAMLHPNEVVVNDDLTQRLRTFLSESEQKPATNSVMERTIAPNITVETATPNIVVNVPEVTSNVIPIETLRARREATQQVSNTTNVQDIINTNSANYDNSRSLINNYDNTRSLVNNINSDNSLTRNLTKNIYEDNVRNLYSNVNTDNTRSVANSLSTVMNNYDNQALGDNISTNQNDFSTNNNISDTLYKSVSNTSTNTTNKSATNNSSSTGKVDNSITFNEGAIQITMTNGNDADIDKLVKQIAIKLKKEANLRSTLNYKPLVG